TTIGTNSSTYSPASGEVAAGKSRTYACFVTPTAGSSVSCGTADWASTCRKITVLATYSTGSITSANQTGATSLCASPTPTPSSITFSSAVTGSGSFNYQWYYKEVTGTTPPGCPTAGQTTASWGGTTIGTNSATYTPASGEVAAGKSRTYACFVTPVAGSFVSCGTADWASGCRMITVLPAFTTGTLASGDQTGAAGICSSGPAANSMTFSTAPTGSGSFTYQWYYKEVSGTTPLACPGSGSGFGTWTSTGATNGGQTITYTPSAGEIAVGYSRTYACFVTPVAGSFVSCGTADWASGCRKITVVADPSLSVLPNPSMCNGGSTTLTTTITGGTGSFIYIWAYSVDNSYTTNTTVYPSLPTGISYNSSPTNSLTITGDGTEASQADYYKFTLVDNGLGCPNVSAFSTVTIVDDPVLTGPADDSVCQSTSLILTTAAAGGTGTYNYQWQYSTTGTGGWTNITNGSGSVPSGMTYSGVTTASLTLTPNTTVAVGGNNYYMCILSSNTPSLAGCNAASQVSRVFVLLAPSGTAVLDHLYTCDATAELSIASFSSSSTVAWTKVSGPGSPTPTTSTSTPFTVSNLSAGTTVYNALMANSGCANINAGSVNIVMPVTSSTNIASSASCSYCVMADGNTRTYYNNNGEIIASIQDDPLVTPGALNLTEVCTRINPSVQTIPDNLGNLEPYLQRQWTITPANNTNSIVTLYFKNSELASLQAYANGTIYQFSGYNLLVSKYHGGSNGTFTPPCTGGTTGCMPVTAENVPAVFSAYGSSDHKVAFIINSFSTFYIHPALFPYAPLPVELTSFTGWNEETVNKLLWITASEINTAKYEVQKSLAAATWNTIGEKAAFGNSNQVRTYNFTDNDPVIGNNYYRLKIIDNDGKFTYSNIINIPIGEAVVNSFVNVYPNPTGGLLNVEIQSVGAYESRVVAYDILGMKTYEKVTALNKGINKLQFDFSLLAKGTYILQFTDSDAKLHTTKFVKE
ncbi:MAG: type sorting protein, partial [Bacteroidota bacterium]|nr:type sorting protein [Bacteroidota bacterium]